VWAGRFAREKYKIIIKKETHIIIFSRSRGLTTVRLAAPAKPPAMK
jgi:hypothetical protein